MYISFETLLSLLVFFPLGIASISLRYAAPLDESQNRTLVRRVRIPAVELPAVQTAQNIFNIGTPGNAGACTAGQLAIINNWLIEVLELHDAAITAWSEAKKGDLGSVMVLQFLMGVKWEGPGILTSTTSALYGKIGERLNAVAQFLDGGGLSDSKTSKPPYLFCDDSFATLAEPNQAVLDSNGDTIPILDQNQKVTGYETISGIFQGRTWTSSMPFWMYQFKAYTFSGNGASLCGKPTVQATTANQRELFSSSDPNIKTGLFGAFMLFCPSSFEASEGAHSAKALDDALTYNGYPTAGIGPGLDEYAPYSATLYHELFHLTEGEEETGDPYVSIQSIYKAALTAGGWNTQSTEQIATNPESFTQFAVAAYIYQNPPTAPAGSPAKPAIVFSGGIPRTIVGVMEPNSGIM